MKNTSVKFLTVWLLIALLGTPSLKVFAQVSDITPPPFPDISTGRGRGVRGAIPTDKLTPELRQLYGQFGRGASRGGDKFTFKFSERDLQEIFGINDVSSGNPMVGIAVTTKNTAVLAAITAIGMKVFLKLGDTIYGEAPVLTLGEIVKDKGVTKIAAIKSAKIPESPKEKDVPSFGEMGTSRGKSPMESGKPAALANEFSKAGLTGKGVVIGVIDTGIDWQHKDFIKPDGTSRILAIWDLLDNSFVSSGGKIGTAAPTVGTGGTSAVSGTVYTNAQINAALKGSGTIKTTDLNGHGTAVAGTAAGNGSGAVAPMTSEMVIGVAPEADIIVVRASGCGSFSNAYIYGAKWMIETAQKLNRPIVINQSFGGHYTTHQGTEVEENFLNQLTGKGKPGVIFTVSAGNEGRYNMHAAGNFGAQRAGQADSFSSPISVNIPAERAGKGSLLLGVFDNKDDWGVAVRPNSPTPFVDQENKPLLFYIFKTGGELKYALKKGQTAPPGFDEYIRTVLDKIQIGTTKDTLALGLPAGSYDLFGFGATEKVTNGEFDIYAPAIYAVDFGMGTTKTGMVGSPGNAANVITVGAFNFRNSWANNEGSNTFFNFQLGGISDYSSPGGKRKSDGVFKPDIASPANYTLSSLSQNSRPGSDSCKGDNMGVSLGKKFVTADGNYIAWNGTSASSPFTAGVIALMLQKNPSLDAEDVRGILTRTALKNGFVGAVPNAEWGNGMINPAAAITATPTVGAKPKSR